jgi:ABC-type branched-subunit amino acid transport system substrate-binding protein
MYADAVRRAGSTDPERVREAIAKSSFDAILGPMQFDANNQAHSRMMYMVVEHGTVQVKELAATK